MGDDEDVAPGEQVGRDVVLPVGDQPAHDVGEASVAGSALGGHEPRSGDRSPGGSGRRPPRARAARRSYARQALTCSRPYFSAVSFLFRPCERPVVALVQAPVPPDGEVAAPGGGEGDVRRVHGPGEHGGVDDVESQVRLGAESSPAARASFRRAALRSTSTHPVKRFSAFQVLWPWRSRMSVAMRARLPPGDTRYELRRRPRAVADGRRRRGACR